MTDLDQTAREAALLNRPSGTVVCTCASIPPTMPTCRDKHLPSCPVAREEAWLAALVKAEKALAFSRMNAQRLEREAQLLKDACDRLKGVLTEQDGGLFNRCLEQEARADKAERRAKWLEEQIAKYRGVSERAEQAEAQNARILAREATQATLARQAEERTERAEVRLSEAREAALNVDVNAGLHFESTSVRVRYYSVGADAFDKLREVLM